MKKKKVLKRIKLKKWVRFSILFFVVAIFLIGIHIISRGFSLERTKEQAQVLYDYNVYQGVNYKVYLNKNSFIDKEFLPMGESYISDLIKNIDINYNIQYQGSKIVPLKVTTYVKANIHGQYASSTEVEGSSVWKKEYIIKEEKVKEIKEESNFLITDNIKLDFNKYNKEVVQFRKELGLPITANLNLSIFTKVEGTLEEEFNLEKEIKLTIPLNQQVITIDEEYEKETMNSIYEKNTYVGKMDSKNLVCGIILIVNAIAILIIFFKEIFDIRKKTLFNLEIKKIMKSYGDIIVEVEEKINIDDYTAIRVKNFNEIVDLEEELRSPIIYFEEEMDYKGIFFIVHGDICYYYDLSNDSLKSNI